MNPAFKLPLWHRWMCGLVLVSALASTGCQVDIAGQTLPSPYYHADDIQYFPPGPEFMLANEAAALRKYRAERELQQEEELPQP